MKIEQCYSAFGTFGPKLRDKYNLRPYKDRDKPCLFFGLYGRQVEQVFKHNSMAVVLWSGSDVSSFKNNEEWVERLGNRPNTFFIADSSFIEQDMKDIGYEFKSLPVVVFDINEITPQPLGDSIYVYKEHAYGNSFNRAVRKALPSVPIISTTHTTYERGNLTGAYKQSFIGLRCIPHDGVSHTVAELGLMGRPVIWNGGAPNTIHYTSEEDVVWSVGNIYRQRGAYDWEDMAAACHDYYDIGSDFLTTEYYV